MLKSCLSTTMFAIIILVCVAITSAAFTIDNGQDYQRPLRMPYKKQDIKVPVVLGVMSRCPDALLCESVFEQVLRRVNDKVDISLTFIGK